VPIKKFLFDFFPILLFFVAYKMHDDPTQGIIQATIVAIIASVGQVAYSRIRHGHVEKTHLITMILILVFGGLTIWLENPLFIKWKPSILNWLFGLVFLGSQYIGPKPIIRRMMESSIGLPKRVWSILSWSWVLFFIALGFVNLYVVYNYDTDTWVNFKLFGMLALTAVFMVGQGFYIMRHATDPDPEHAAPAPGQSDAHEESSPVAEKSRDE
jgi:intracellular septation protein